MAILFESIIFGFLALDISMIAIFTIRLSRAGKRMLSPVTAGLFLFMLFSGAIVIYGSFIEPNIITVTEISRAKSMPFIPKETELTIALISDFHLGPYKNEKFVGKVVEKLKTLNPDLILIAGDFIFLNDTKDIPKTMSAFRRFSELSPTLGIFAVLGNHDYNESTYKISGTEGERNAMTVKTELEKAGVRVLINDSVPIIKDDKNLFTLGGLKEIWTKDADVTKTFSYIPKKNIGGARVLLTHNPDSTLLKGACDMDIILAGHTHGGQIRLPFWGSVPQIPDTLGNSYDQGFFPRTGDCGKNGSLPPLLITRGLGESGPRARLFAPPEIIMIR